MHLGKVREGQPRLGSKLGVSRSWGRGGVGLDKVGGSVLGWLWGERRLMMVVMGG